MIYSNCLLFNSSKYEILKVENKVIQGSLWEDAFHLYELTDIVCQISDLEFVDILSRVREGKHTSTDIKK